MNSLSDSDVEAPVGAPQWHDDRVTRSFLTLAAGELGARLIGFVATIYLARQLGVEAYGVLGFAFALVLYATAVVDLGIEQLGPREVADRHVPLDTLVSSVLLMRLVVSAATAALLALAGVFLITHPEGLVLAVFAITLLAAGANARWVHVGLERSGLVAVARIAAELVKVGGVVALVHGPDDVLLAPLAYVAGDAVGTLILLGGLHAARIRLQFHWDRALVRGVLSRARPLLFASILGMILYNADVLMLRIFRDRVEVGFYLVAYLLLNFVGVLGTSMTLSLIPSLRRLHDTPVVRLGLYHNSVLRALAVGLPIAVGAVLLAPQILALVFGPEYDPSAGALRILIWSFPLFLLRCVEQAALIAAGKQERVLHTTALAAGANVTLNLAAIPLFGMIGAAVTTVLAEIVRLAFARRYARGEAYSATPTARTWRPFLAAGVMAASIVLVAPSNVWLGVALGFVVYLGALAATGAIAWRGTRPQLRL